MKNSNGHSDSDTISEEAQRLQERAKIFSARVPAALGWIDETVAAWQRIKRARDAAKTSSVIQNK